jgi:VIT1/CCC1 family predicted Fe2+/Mn2+ transporter
MTVMSSAVREGEVNDVARAAGLSQAQTHNFRNVAASMAMEGMALTLEGTSSAAGAQLRPGARVQVRRILSRSGTVRTPRGGMVALVGNRRQPGRRRGHTACGSGLGCSTGPA